MKWVQEVPEAVSFGGVEGARGCTASSPTLLDLSFEVKLLFDRVRPAGARILRRVHAARERLVDLGTALSDPVQLVGSRKVSHQALN